MIKILFLMMLLHVIDDFVFQPICLSKLKQEKWWKEQEGYSDKYKNDYKFALLIHAMSWAIMISLPLMFMTNVSSLGLFIIVFINTIIHYVTDDAKANTMEINLVTDQKIHLSQIIVTWFLVVLEYLPF